MRKVLLAGPYVGEFGWENLRFAPHILWKKRVKHKNKVKLVVYTRDDRFDLYGQDVFEFKKLSINGDYTKFTPDCFKLTGFNKYQDIAKEFFNEYNKRFDIVEHIYPSIKRRDFQRKDLFNWNEMDHVFKPRKRNKELIDNIISNGKENIVLAPRFRKGIKRNWPFWITLYDMIEDSGLLEKYNFILCGKYPEYIPDPKSRFFDINNIILDENSSLIGIAIEIIKSSILTVGSQSGIPNLSNLLMTPTLQWGHQKWLHEKTYNVKKTKCIFLLDKRYNIETKIIFKNINKFLSKRKK